MKLKELKSILCGRERIQTAIIYDCKRTKTLTKGLSNILCRNIEKWKLIEFHLALTLTDGIVL